MRGVRDLNAKNVGIGFALASLIATLIGRVEGVITDEHLFSAVMVVLAVGLSAFFSYLISWSATSGFKRYHWPPDRWREQAVKRKIFKCAWWSAGIPMAVFGAGILAWATTGKTLLVCSILWSVLVALVAFTSPGLRDFVVDNLIPRLKRWARGRERGENEALDRPSEVPRD